MKLMLNDLKAGDKWVDEVVDKVWTDEEGRTHILFESGRTFAMESKTLITIEREV